MSTKGTKARRAEPGIRVAQESKRSAHPRVSTLTEHRSLFSAC